MDRLHPNWDVTPQRMAELKKMKKADLLKVIDSKNLFGGLPTQAAVDQRQQLYDKIKSWSPAEKAGQDNGVSDTTSDVGSDNGGQEDLGEKES